MRVEPKEAPLAGHVPVRVEALHAHVVEIRRAVHGGARVRLREGEDTRRGRRAGVRTLERPPQDAEAWALGTVPVIFAVAEEREVMRLEPLEERRRLLHVIAAGWRASASKLRRHVKRLVP